MTYADFKDEYITLFHYKGSDEAMKILSNARTFWKVRGHDMQNSILPAMFWARIAKSHYN